MRPGTVALAMSLLLAGGCALDVTAGRPRACPSQDPNEPVSNTDPPQPPVPERCLPKLRRDDSIPMRVVCRAFYRPSVTVANQARTRIVVAKNGDDKTRLLGPFRVRARYFDNSFEGRSILISAGLRDRGRSLVTELYQVDRTRKTANQFDGGHGFTGLVYVNHPSSPAELQYFCRAG